jgi:hypothetical protein
MKNQTSLENNNEAKIFAPGEGVERQQTVEEILFALEYAKKTQEMIKIIFKNPDGKFSKKVSVILWSFADGVIRATTESGEEISIEFSQIEKVEQKKDQGAPLDVTTPPETPIEASPEVSPDVSDGESEKM